MTENERWPDPEFVTPDINKIQCKDCVFRQKDVLRDGKVVLRGATKGICDVYPIPVWKPDSILFGGEPCDYYVSENEEEDE
ncbi:MAG: hypothetical protein Q4F31_09835 [Eubacteriales bacterium]|nr:hypothetical protein [Eubacteriales bacterium]